MKRILLALAVLSASALSQNAQQPTPPPYCKPCLFYGGDFDPNGPSPNMLSNGDDLLSQGVVYVPFEVPPNQTWTVAGLLSNNLLTKANLAPPQIEWSISTGISLGNGGTVTASGVDRKSVV